MPLRPDLLDPIPGENPSGQNLRHEILFSNIREARRADDDGTRRPDDPPPKASDWPKVLELTTTALARQSKDLELAGWMTEALLHREGIAGLHAGLDTLRELLTRYWDTVYPPLVEDDEDDPVADRAARLRWVGSYLVTALQDVPITRKGYGLRKQRESRKVGSEADCGGDDSKLAARQQLIDQGQIPAEEFDRAVEETPKAWYKALVAELKATIASLKALDSASRERMPDDPPEFEPLQNALADLERVVQPILQRKLEIDPDPVDVTAEAGEGTGAGAEGEQTGAVPIEPRSVDDAWSRIAAVARYLREQQPDNPGPYLMLRALRWGELRAGGGEVNPKLLVAPPTGVRSQLKSLLLDGRWKELLNACETVMARPDARGWLDLQRYAITACDNIGPEFEVVNRALRSALAQLLRDIPTLPDMAMMDDTGTANAETKAWLREEGIVPPDGAATEGEPAAPVLRTSRAIRIAGDPTFERAQEAARSGDHRRAIELLSAEVARERSVRARFLRRVQIASIMVDAGMEPLAKPILEEILAQVDTYSLEQWEAGEVVAQPLSLMVRCLAKLDADGDRRQEIYLRVARLDPIQAMSLPS